MYGICWVPFYFFEKPLVKNTFFKSFPTPQPPPQKKRSDCESEKSGLGFDATNPPWVWILWIHDPFLDTGIRICIFQKKRTPSHVKFKV